MPKDILKIRFKVTTFQLDWIYLGLCSLGVSPLELFVDEEWVDELNEWMLLLVASDDDDRDGCDLVVGLRIV